MTTAQITELNKPKFDRNRLSFDDTLDARFSGIVNDFINISAANALYDAELYKRFVNCFRVRDDSFDAGWRGEFWGKVMRGAVFTYSYTRDPELYSILENTVKDILSTEDELGRISSYSVEKEFIGWDIWSRKYVLLGLEYFLEVCENNELSQKIIDTMSRTVYYIISKIGDKSEGKKPITDATNHWRGINSVSILEPIVRLYNLTGNKDFFDFAEYIVSTGGTSVENVFKLAYDNRLKPYQYPVTKAYEMTSAFEGLLEFYRITGKEEYKTAIVNYADRILETDFTVIGCSGCTHELFDHSTVRQANGDPDDDVCQETCVTVTMMKFFYNVTMLTGDTKYVDAFERSLYNAYFGAVNTENYIDEKINDDFPDAVLEAMPFDSYNPLCDGTRGKRVGGLKMLFDNHYYGCCAAIGMLGMGLIKNMALMKSENGLALNLFINGTYETTVGDKSVKMSVRTEYPRSGSVKIKFFCDLPCAFQLKIRIPNFSLMTHCTVCGKRVDVKKGEYLTIERTFSNNDEIELIFDMTTRVEYPVPYGEQVLMNKVIWGHNYIVPTYDKEDENAKRRIALLRGPIVLASDSRIIGNLKKPLGIITNPDGTVDAKIVSAKSVFPAFIEAEIRTADGTVLLTDYASAGRTYDEESRLSVWIMNK